jgi:hypothetical protein
MYGVIMEMDNQIEKPEFLDELLSVFLMYNILVKNPRKKVNRLTFNALLWIIVPLICLALLQLLSIYHHDYRMSHLFSQDHYCKFFLDYAKIISCIALSIGVCIHFKVQNMIPQLLEEYRNHKFIITKDFLEFYVKGEKRRLKSDEILFVLINKYSLCFFSNDPLLSVGFSIKNKNKILNIISDDIVIIDNSMLY